MARSSMYTDSHPSPTSVWKIMFIIIWKVAGEFVRPKNMTIGSNSPSGVRNAAFHSSPSLMWMLLYPHLTSNFVKRVQLLRQSMTWGMRGDTFLLWLVHLFSGH